MASNGCEELMQAWFPRTTTTERKSLTEPDIRDIAQVLLRTSDVSWSRIPRIYSVLRIIDQLHAIDSFLAEGITDVWFPFSQRSLPTSFQTQSARLDFLDVQQLVFNTKALNLERKHTRHGHFTDTTEIPLKKIGELGKGGYGYVDRVVSTFSHREYARKLIPRGRTFKKDKQVLQAFERELSSLKSVSQQHMHIVELVGSYTDPKYVGILMLPVADCNLHEFLMRPLDDGEKSLLRTFFGCLTSALCFLHNNRIRHKDIKPQNVLIKNGHVFLTDFGLSLDWTELSHSTTTGPTWSTPRYGAPEVAEHSARNSSADIWSLGCVFLEIWTVLKQEIVQALYDHMESTGTLSSCYCSNLASISSWIEIVKGLPGPSTDNAPSAWIVQMLQRDRDARWTAHNLSEHIHEYSSDPTAPFAFSGLCCLVDDDTAESVHSSIGEDMDELTFRPTTSPMCNLHPSEPIALPSQTEAVSICEVPVPSAPYVQSRKRVQISPHQVQSSLLSSVDLAHVSQATETSDTFGHVPLPGTLLLATEGYNQSHQRYPPQPYVEEEEASVAREIHTTITNPASTLVSSPENGDIENSNSKRWVFFSTKTDRQIESNPLNDINVHRKIPEKRFHDMYPTDSSDSDLTFAWDEPGWLPEYDSDWESRLRGARALSVDRYVPRRVPQRPFRSDGMGDKGKRNRVSKHPIVTIRTSGGEQDTEFNSDGSMTAHVDREKFQRSVPSSQPIYTKKHDFPTPEGSVRMSPDDFDVANGQRDIRRSGKLPHIEEEFSSNDEKARYEAEYRRRSDDVRKMKEAEEEYSSDDEKARYEAEYRRRSDDVRKMKEAEKAKMAAAEAREKAENRRFYEDPEPNRHRARSRSPLRPFPTVLHREIPRVECLVCMNDLPVDKTAILGCGHRMCHSCLKGQFVLSVHNPQHMPPRCCSVEHIPLKYVERLFDDKFKKLWNKKYREYTIENRLYCPRKGCGEWIKPGKVQMDLTSGMKYARCDRCRKKVCILCNNKFHTGECPNDEETYRLVQIAKDQGWQRCYSCKLVVKLKDDGNHLTCRCTAQFCMVCALPWKTCNCPWFNYKHINDDDSPNNVRGSTRREADEGDGEHKSFSGYIPESKAYARKVEPNDVKWRRNTPSEVLPPELGRHATFVY